MRDFLHLWNTKKKKIDQIQPNGINGLHWSISQHYEKQLLGSLQFQMCLWSLWKTIMTIKRTRVMWNNLPDVFRTATRAATGRRAKAPWGTDRQSHERRDLKTKRLQIVDWSFISGVLTSVIVMGGYKRSASWDCCHASHLFTRALDGNLEKNKIKWWWWRQRTLEQQLDRTFYM